MTPETEKPRTAAEIAKDRLKQYIQLKREVECEKERIDALYGPRIPNNSGMPHGSGVSDPTGNASKLISERKKIYEAIEAEFLEFQADLEKDMLILTPTERTLVRFKYMDGLKWEAVCGAIGYSWTHTHRIHSAALIKLGEHIAMAQG